MTHAWIAETGALGAAALRWSQRKVLGLDTEFTRVNTFWPELALLQIADAGDVDLIDTLAFDAGPGIGTLLQSSTIIKVIHSASEDLVALAPLCSGRFGGLFDSQIAASFAGLGHSLGYRKLVELLFDIVVPKDETRSDWRRRPLSPQQLEYAVADVAHLAAIYALLTEKLAARGMLAWCAEDCARLAATAGALEVAPANPHWEFRSSARWPLERQARLKRLLEYREKLARAINRPRQWIFDNEAAVALVSEPMLDPDQIVALLARQRSFPRSERERFPVWMAEPLSAEELDIEPAPAQFEGDERRRADQLKLAVDQRAAELDLPPALLAPRRLIEAIVRGDDAPELQGWRGEALRSLL